MAKAKQQDPLDQAIQNPKTLGEYAYEIIKEQYQRITKQEKKVLADKQPEALHQMRVGTRRLRTALQVFDAAIKLPKAGSADRLRKLARVLGEVRDLDVQTASLQTDYYPNLDKPEQKHLDKVTDTLTTRRKQAFSEMKQVLNQPLYQELKMAYEDWLQQPRYTAIAQLPISALLPDLLSPLLSELLLHPGWLVSFDQVASQNGDQNVDRNSITLHDLRKVCKHVRYQAEFFTPFYPDEFQNWIEEIKTLQDQLGEFQDSQVFVELLGKALDKQNLPNLKDLISQKQRQALSNWEVVRHKYLDGGFRYHLHQMLLQPIVKTNNVHPELVDPNDTQIN